MTRPWPQQHYLFVYHYYIHFKDSLYTVNFPLAGTKNMTVFVVYNLHTEQFNVDVVNPLISSGSVKDPLNHRTLCFTPMER